MYRSVAARARRERRRKRTQVIGMLSIILGGIVGIGVGLGLAAALMPGHEILERLF